MWEDLPCEACRGVSPAVETCATCRGRGHLVISGCPRKRGAADLGRSLQHASFAKHGVLPRTGGLDRQRHRDVRLIQLIWNELSLIEAEEYEK